MNCPICHVALTMADRQGVEIDYCPKCRGIWLDRGELDKLIERAAPESAMTRDPDDPRRYYRAEHDDWDRHGHHRRKRKSLLGEIFDFD